MNIQKGNVAVITGAASGIGKAIANGCLSQGMRVVVADIEEEALLKATEILQAHYGSNVLPVITDVSSLQDVQNLAEFTVANFGEVHLLFNNAGVTSPGSPWETTIDDWTWVMGVNLWGVIYGVKAFMPIMLKQECPCHIVNTASAAGLVYGNGPATYAVTKHAVVALTEDLYFHLQRRRLPIHTSVICPGLINTSIVDSARNRPADLDDQFPGPGTPQQRKQNRRRLLKAMENAMGPGELADVVFQGIAKQQLYIQTHQESNSTILTRAAHH